MMGSDTLFGSPCSTFKQLATELAAVIILHVVIINKISHFNCTVEMSLIFFLFVFRKDFLHLFFPRNHYFEEIKFRNLFFIYIF